MKAPGVPFIGLKSRKVREVKIRQNLGKSLFLPRENTLTGCVQKGNIKEPLMFIEYDAILKSPMVTLKRFIFDIRFQPTFSWLDKKGNLLDYFKNKQSFESVSYSEKSIGFLKESENDYKNITLEATKISGSVEGRSLEMQGLKDFVYTGMDICDRATIDIVSNLRVGARFFFFKETSFDFANKFFLSSINAAHLQAVGGTDCVDMAIRTVAKLENNMLRLECGPIKSDEYPRYFKNPDAVDAKESAFFDIDYYSSKNNSKRFDKFVQEGYKKAFDVVSRISDQMDLFKNGA